MILEKIADATRARVFEAKKRTPAGELRKKTTPPPLPFTFERSLSADGISFICEVKKASPSKGIITQDFPYIEIAQEYERAGADAVSVLTEPEFFLGRNEYLSEIKRAVRIPVLRKDFIVDEYQIWESAAIGADAILLICALLDTGTLAGYIKIADSLGLSCLVEAHDREEIASALSAGARIVGVNNRDLKTFEVDIANSLRLRKYVPKDILFVSESGIKTPGDIVALRECGADAVLIGETFMRSADKKEQLDQLRGEIHEN